jgi:SpoVK/Ycf46/Vps4 family AAA+-type ATPase
MLFESFGSSDERKFVNAAEAIIERELAANNHGYANVLRQALKERSTVSGAPSSLRNLSVLPRDRRSGEDLLWFVEPTAGLTEILCSGPARATLERLLTEQRVRLRLRAHGLQPMNRLLFWGPPGNGKTATATAIGFELGLPVAIVRLDSLISSYLGDTASHLNRIFSRASETPMVLLFDEVDSIAKRRDDARDVGELKRVVNALIQQIDRSTNAQSVFVAASNHQHMLDPAVWRRFDAVVEFPLPTDVQRLDLLQRVLRDVKVQGGLKSAASAGKGLSFSELERCARAALKTMVIEERKSISGSGIAKEIRLYKGQQFKARSSTGRNNER